MNFWREAVRKYRKSLLMAIIAWLSIMMLTLFGALEQVEYTTEDIRFRLRPPLKVNERIIIIEIDNKTLQAWNEPVVFWGNRFANILKNSRKYGAKITGIDFVFASDPDKWLLNELETPFVVASKLPVEPILRSQSDRFLNSLPNSLQPNKLLIKQLSDMDPQSVVLADEPNIYAETLDKIRDLTKVNLGSVMAPDKQGGVQREGLLVSNGRNGEFVPSFVGMIAALSKGVNPHNLQNISEMGGQSPTRGIDVHFLINYVQSPPSKHFRRIKAELLEADKLDENDAKMIFGSILLVGSTYDGSNDLHPTPGGFSMTGIEVNANALDTLLEHRPMKRYVPFEQAAVTLFLGIPMMLLLTLSFSRGAMFASILSLVWCCFSQFMYSKNLLLPVAAPVVTLFAPFLLFHAVRSVEETLIRKDIETVFGRTVAPSVRDYLMDDPRRLQLDGHTMEASVLFFDIRDSVNFAESRPPEEAFAALNRLFAELVPIVDRNGGLLNKFTGDGFMAVFGVPAPMSNHAQRAFDTACEIVRTTYVYNECKSEPTGKRWRIGCGVYSGRLAYGNVGVQQRSEFTVIGMTPSLAARLENLNKTLQSEIVIGKSTFDQLDRHPLNANGPCEMKIAGLDEPVIIYYINATEPELINRVQDDPQIGGGL